MSDQNEIEFKTKIHDEVTAQDTLEPGTPKVGADVGVPEPGATKPGVPGAPDAATTGPDIGVPGRIASPTPAAPAPPGAAKVGPGSDVTSPDTTESDTQNTDDKRAKHEPPKKDELHPKRQSLQDRLTNRRQSLNEGLKDTGKQLRDKLARKEFSKDTAKLLGRGLGQLIQKAALAAVDAIIGFFGWPVLLGCAVIVILLMLISVGLFAATAKGKFGKTWPTQSGTGNTSVQQLLANSATSVTSGATTYFKFQIIASQDKDYLSQGKADARLVKALDYLVSKHKRIAVRHIVSGYIDMPTNPEAGDQLAKNVSAHKEGLAADVTEVDFVYKVFQENTECTTATFGAVGDLYYYNDKGDQLYFGLCQAVHAGGIVPSGNIPFVVSENSSAPNGRPAEAVPIKLCWQDTKPNNNHLDLSDVAACTTQLPIFYQQVFQPEARRKTHQIIDELLQFPLDSGDANKYKITQLITYSNDRDVEPFQSKEDEVYGTGNNANYGLFAMIESWTQVHIAY